MPPSRHRELLARCTPCLAKSADKEFPVIPSDELQLWDAELTVAEELAAKGRPLDGYRSLDAALASVEVLRHEPWSENLLNLYRAALMLFCETHRLSALLGNSAPTEVCSLGNADAQADLAPHHPDRYPASG